MYGEKIPLSNWYESELWNNIFRTQCELWIALVKNCWNDCWCQISIKLNCLFHNRSNGACIHSNNHWVAPHVLFFLCYCYDVVQHYQFQRDTIYDAESKKKRWMKKLLQLWNAEKLDWLILKPLIPTWQLNSLKLSSFLPNMNFLSI